MILEIFMLKFNDNNIKRRNDYAITKKKIMFHSDVDGSIKNRHIGGRKKKKSRPT